jgi:hypothetical protein
MEWNEVKNSVWFTFQMGSHIVGQKALNYKTNFQVSDLTEIICSPFRNFPFAVANPLQSTNFDGKKLRFLPVSWVKTAWQTLQGHMRREVESWAVSGWQARCLRRLPSLT